MRRISETGTVYTFPAVDDIENKWLERMQKRLSVIEDILGDDYDLDRLKELVEADREGRCEIHAAKDGATVYSIFLYVNGLHSIRPNGDPLHKIAEYEVNEFTRNTVDREFGKTVFLTREEAEAALKKMNEGDE